MQERIRDPKPGTNKIHCNAWYRLVTRTQFGINCAEQQDGSHECVSYVAFWDMNAESGMDIQI